MKVLRVMHNVQQTKKKGKELKIKEENNKIS